MRYDSYLATNEDLSFQIRLHWVVFARVVLETVGVLAAAAAISVYTTVRHAGAHLLVTLLWWVAVAAVVRLLWRLLDWHLTVLLITSSRIMRVSGIVSRRVQSMPLSKITDLSYTLDPNGRLLGYGTFAMETEGDHKHALEKVEHVPHPDRFYLRLCDSIFGGAPEPAVDD
ncbi:YdbS-like PH domain-containing protein [Frankia sp. AiPs1]|uniref:PH domain-containing protein n=1 Tax=Frankia sp. AiPa1 TaxID=573492 RepID=UPI00202B7396|nr:PH domain-containing protein [Frankia sp. AiPa1]MCL9761708.1 PH domain-containing protein [Frankia sp. AiPa1]